MTTESDKYISEGEKGLSTDIIKAKKKIQKVVDDYNKPYLLGLTDDSLRIYADRNVLYRKWHVELYGDQSITTLLPTELMWDFNNIINPLLRGEIRVKQDLVNSSKRKITSIRGVGPVRSKFILAMRDLAIAESKTQK